MESLLLTSTFALEDKSKRTQVVVGLAAADTIVVAIRPTRSPAFILSSDDWNNLSEKLQQLDGANDIDKMYEYALNHCKMMYTPQRQLTLSYYPSWKDALLNTNPQSITMSAKATSALVKLLSTINSIVTRMSSLTSSFTAGLDSTPSNYVEGESSQIATPEAFGFYNEPL